MPEQIRAGCAAELDESLVAFFRAWEQSMVARTIYYANVASGLLAEAPPGFTYPELTAEAVMIPTADNSLGTIYMPRFETGVLQTVDTSQATVLTLPAAGAIGQSE